MCPRPSVGVIGLGLIGGSAAKAFCRAGFTVKGYDQNLSTMQQAFHDGVIQNRESAWQQWADTVDWVVMAPPLARVGEWLAEWAAVVRREQVVVDVSSVKLPIVPVLAALPGHLTPLCLHPMAGRERTGYEASRADLFDGHVCAVIPVPGHGEPPKPVIDEVLEAWRMRQVSMDAASHDRVTGLVSHLPYVVSAALLVVAERTGSDLGPWPEMAGPGFMDTSRVGSSDPSLWNEIVQANRDALIPDLEAYRQVIESWLDALRQGRKLDDIELTPAIRARTERGKLCN